MKILSWLPIWFPSPTFHSAFFLALVLCFTGGTLSASVVSEAADDGPYRINVASEVERSWTRWSMEPYREHGRCYAIMTLTRWARIPLARPVDEPKLLVQLRRALAARGFYEARPGQQPNILLNVLYGRGHIKNPYTGHRDSDGQLGAAKRYYEAESTPGIGYEGIIRADCEKLFIGVYAWKCPATAQETPFCVWRMYVTTDDPDEDLNRQSEKMLMAGSVFFDHATDTPQVIVPSYLPQGHVTVGTPTVVESKQKK